ncbi:hypothetical protein HZC30_00225 [Candidatus Woesearchaeota archaeon]|nr:hypothetical protein [Candidatus Woesearchaeota archaeon]
MVCRPHQYTLARIAYPSFQTMAYQTAQLYQQAGAYATTTLGSYNFLNQYSSRTKPSQNYNTSYFDQKVNGYNFPITNNPISFSAPVEFFKAPIKRIVEEKSSTKDTPKQPSVWSQPKTYQALPLQDYSVHQTSTNRKFTTQNPSPIDRDQLSFLIQAELGNMEVQHVLH